MTKYEIHDGQVTKVEWAMWPMALKEKFPISVGDIVNITINYCPSTNQQAPEFNYSVKIGDLTWECEGPGFDRSEEGEFPNIDLSQIDFINPWESTIGNYEQSDQSIISLSLKEGGQASLGKIESQGELDLISSVFVIEYKFDSKIHKETPTISSIVIM